MRALLLDRDGGALDDDMDTIALFDECVAYFSLFTDCADEPYAQDSANGGPVRCVCIAEMGVRRRRGRWS